MPGRSFVLLLRSKKGCLGGRKEKKKGGGMGRGERQKVRGSERGNIRSKKKKRDAVLICVLHKKNKPVTFFAVQRKGVVGKCLGMGGRRKRAKKQAGRGK